MVMKWTAVCLVALALLGCFCDAQWVGYKPSTHYQKPPQESLIQDSTKNQDREQSKQEFEKPLTWKYPEDPQPEPQPEVPFEQRYPVPAATVAVECRERDARVEVKKDMFGMGQFINPADLTLGNCAVGAEDTAAQVLIFETQLQDCGSSLAMTEDVLIYSFSLNYNPESVVSSPIVRSGKAAVIVECHYPRKHNVSSLPLDPQWIPFSAVKIAEEFLYFTLKLMTDDWQYERPSYQYFLGDMINIEATVKQYFHVPLRVYVDSCVATLAPDVNSNPRYSFIENHGCLVDAKITGSNSKFVSRPADNKLQFQFEAFRFQGADSGLLYLTCHLRATCTRHDIDSEHRACSFVSGWREVTGAVGVCDSCETVAYGSAGGGYASVRPSSGGYGSGQPSSGGHGSGRPSSGGHGSAGASSGRYGSAGSSSGGHGSAGSSSGGYGSAGTSSGGYGSAGTFTGGYAGGGTSGRRPSGSASGSSFTHGRKIRDVSQMEVIEWEGDVALGPISIAEKILA